jgi:very-short-patch-repair endonuclease
VIRARHFDRVGTEEVAGFPCTNVAETILTLSMRLPPSLIERYLDDRLAGRALKIQDFHPILERLEFARQPGLRPLRRIISSRADDAYQPPATELERLLYRLLANPAIPPSERQVPFAYPSATATVDAYISRWRLIVEADGRRWHTREQDFQRDRERDHAALAAGLVVVRFTWKMLRYQPEDCLRILLDVGKARA